MDESSWYDMIWNDMMGYEMAEISHKLDEIHFESIRNGIFAVYLSIIFHGNIIERRRRQNVV